MPHGFVRRAAALWLLLVVSGLSNAYAQAGRISGQVTDHAGTAIEGARLLVVGTSRIETTNRDGRFTFRSINPGRYQVRVFAIGYQSKTDSVSVGPDETAALNISLVAAPVTLDEIVVTATGEQRKLEVANSVSTIDAAKVTEEAPIFELGNLISGRAAGVQVLKSGGTTGTGTRIRIRGSNSISLSNEPLYYIDGVRMESSSESSTLQLAGQTASRINDINPEDIASIEIVKGPAAATLYGIQASNGVVRITTKRGLAGRPRFNMYVEAGAVDDHNRYPDNFFGRDTTASGYDPNCTLQNEFEGNCTQTSLEHSTPLENSATRPLKAGLRQQYGGSLSGGNEFATYYLSGDYESEDGVFRLPAFEEDSVRRTRGTIANNQIRPNALERVNVRANIGAQLSSSADLSANLGYVTSNTRFVENDNSFLTITGSGEASYTPSDVNRGWYYIPAELFAELANQEIGRFTSGLTGNWRPMSWLSTRATVGYDVVNRTDVQFFPTGQVADQDQNRAGLRTVNRFQISQTSVDIGGTARFALSPTLTSKTSIGGQFYRDLTRGTLATGRGLAPGSSTISGAGSVESDEDFAESRSIGTYVEEEVGVKERLFLTGAIRLDDNSAFGRNFNATAYPKASASWLLSDEPFFHLPMVKVFRLRAAFGASGQQPGTTDARRFFRPVAGRKDSVAVTGVTFANLGNPNLKPERSRELEVGFDATLLNERVTLEVTYYNKKTTDALVQRNNAGSLGGTESQFFNLGEVQNRGIEVAIDARIIDAPTFAWDVTLSGSFTSNKLLSLGAGVRPIEFGFYQRHVEGYPLGGFWARPVSFRDANSDGLIDNTEITIGDTAVFMGNALPTREFSLNSALTLFRGRVRVGTQFDYRGGHVVDNSIEQFRCSSAVLNCRGLYDRKAPLREQANAQAVVYGPTSEIAFFEPGWFIKLRELSLTYSFPTRWAAMFRASTMSLTLAGRNLWTITDYSGVDPEVNGFGQDNFSTTDFESQPPVRYWIARLNVGF